MSPAAHVAVGAVRVYQWTVRPVIGANCRFFPSCSDYAVDAFRAHGALRGGGLAAWRILRCNPWNAGGYDPVPSCGCLPPSAGDGQVTPNRRQAIGWMEDGLVGAINPSTSWPGVSRPSFAAPGLVAMAGTRPAMTEVKDVRRSPATYSDGYGVEPGHNDGQDGDLAGA